MANAKDREALAKKEMADPLEICVKCTKSYGKYGGRDPNSLTTDEIGDGRYDCSNCAGIMGNRFSIHKFDIMMRLIFVQAKLEEALNRLEREAAAKEQKKDVLAFWAS